MGVCVDMGKKAQVKVISLVLLILIVLVAIVIVWNVVIPIVSDGGGAEVLPVDLEIQDVFVTVTGASKVTLQRKAGAGEMDGLKFAFYDENGNSHVEDVSENILGELETKTYSFSPTLNFGKMQRVVVVPVLSDNVGREFSATVDKIFELPNSLVSWWRFEDTEDFVGNNPGDLTSGARIMDGELILNGSGFFQATGNNLSLDDEIAISAWVFLEGDGEIVSKGDNYAVLVIDNKINFLSNGNSLISGGSVELNDNEWNHIVISGEWGSTFKIYINNDLSNFSKSSFGSTSTDNSKILIGDDFNGKIDELMIFNQDLFNFQVSSLYNIFKK